jgi:hypothetical protein
VVTVAFQSAFYAEIHQNNSFFILKIFFLKLAHQNYPKYKKKLTKKN